MYRREKNQPLNHIKYPAEYVGLHNLLFDEPSITIRGTGKKALPLEATISNIKIIPGIHFHQTKHHIISYPVRVVEGIVDDGKFKGVIHAEKFVIANHVIPNCQIHFYLEKEGKAYAGKSMDHDEDKKHLTAEMCELKYPLDISGIGTQYQVNLPFFKVMHAHFEPAKKQD